MGFLRMFFSLSFLFVIGYLMYRFLLLEYRVRLVEHRIHHPLFFALRHPPTQPDLVFHEEECTGTDKEDELSVSSGPLAANTPPVSVTEHEDEDEEALIESSKLISAEHLDTPSSRSARLMRMTWEQLAEKAKSQGVEVEMQKGKRVTKGKLIEKILSV